MAVVVQTTFRYKYVILRHSQTTFNHILSGFVGVVVNNDTRTSQRRYDKRLSGGKKDKEGVKNAFQ